jgi:hypothetical protein
MQKSRLSIILLILLIALISGCARTVTTKLPVGNQIVLTYRMEGNINSAYKYYIIFSPTITPLLPNVADDPYLIGPGETYDPAKINIGGPTDNISYYYQNYLYTWSDYIVLEGGPAGNFKITTGPFSSATTSANHYSYTASQSILAVSSSSKNVTVTFDLSRLNNASPITRVYFDFFTVSGNAHLIDHLDSAQSIQNLSTSIVNGDDNADAVPVTNPDLNITTWTVQIQ